MFVAGRRAAAKGGVQRADARVTARPLGKSPKILEDGNLLRLTQVSRRLRSLQAKGRAQIARNWDVHRPSALGPLGGMYRFSSQALCSRRPEASPRYSLKRPNPRKRSYRSASSASIGTGSISAKASSRVFFSVPAMVSTSR